MTGNLTVGIAGVTTASLVWGSCFIVCKGYELPPDGVHFAFLMSIGILFVGLMTLFSSTVEDGDFEAVFSPCGLLGGALWACGNFLTVPIIQCIGLGVGLAIWAGVNMIVAFVVGAMGMEGLGVPLPKEPLQHPACGVFGVLFALCALCLFANVKSDVNEATEESTPSRDMQEVANAVADRESASEPLLEHLEISSPEADSAQQSTEGVENATGASTPSESNPDTLTGNTTMGISLAIVAGVLYGFQLVPLSIWNNKIIHNGHIFDHSLPSDTIRALRFFFSQFAGIFLTGLIGFIGYCVYTRNQPRLVPPEATLPSIFCGMVWAVGCAGAMFATSELGNAVGFPLVLNCSFLINSAWSILVFKEIQGKRNLQLFGGAFLLNVVSSLLISTSKG